MTEKEKKKFLLVLLCFVDVFTELVDVRAELL